MAIKDVSGKIPPQNLDAESSVLGAILLDSDAIVTVADIVSPESFYVPAHQHIYSAMEILYEKRQPIDVVTLTNQLKKMKKLQQVGGTAFVAELSNVVSTAANAKHYAQLVSEAFVKRRLISTSVEINEMAFDPGKDVADIMDLAEQRVFNLSQTQNKKAFLPIKDTLVESFERLDELQKHSGELRGVPTGFADLDRCLAGFQRSNLIILAARPGTGKTALALNMAQHMAVVSKKKVGFFSLEMSREELVDRLLVGQADIDAWKLKTGRLDQQDFLKLSDAMGVLADANIFIDDTPALTIFEMRTRARRLKMEHDIDMLVVDYLQLAHGRTQDNRVTEVAEISQGLKNIARELKIPVLALSQLSRAIESRAEKIPQLADLRESGSIEQDADVVMFLYRKDESIREAVNLKISKHRNGSMADIDLYFRGDRIKFYGMETQREI
jgi:replicative DNA helicase